MSLWSGGNKQSHQRNLSARPLVLVALNLVMVVHSYDCTPHCAVTQTQ